MRPLHARAIALAAALLATLVAGARAQEASVVTYDQAFDVAANGDAAVATTVKLTARQFVNWKEKYGLNPALLKRDVGKSMSQYETRDFKVDQNDMEREVKVAWLVKGLAHHKGDGLFEVRVPKTWKGGERHGNEYRFHFPEALSPGVIAQHSVRVTLPAGAEEFREQLSEEGEKVIEYRLDVGSTAGRWLVGAIAAAVAGIALIAAGLFLPKG